MKALLHTLKVPFYLSAAIAVIPVVFSYLVSLMSYCGLGREGICWFYFPLYLIAEALMQTLYAPVFAYLDFIHYDYFNAYGLWFPILLCAWMYFVVFAIPTYLTKKVKEKNNKHESI